LYLFIIEALKKCNGDPRDEDNYILIYYVPQKIKERNLHNFGGNYIDEIFYNLRPLLLQVFYYIFYYKSSIIKRCPKKKENNQG
jgi:hypothetical protein